MLATNSGLFPPTLKLTFRILGILIASWLFSGCGVYSFSGASVEGKTIHFSTIENHARNIVPSLAPSFTDKLRNRILSQTGLSPVNKGEADYEISGAIINYEYTVSAVQNTQVASQNRLTITINIEFKNKLNPKADFNQGFSQFSDFKATQSIQQVEGALIEEIITKLSDDVFNKAFVNW